MKDIFKWATHIVGLIPGLTVILFNLFIPVSFSAKLLGGLIEACGAFIVIILWVNREKFKRDSLQLLNRRCITFFVLFLLTFFAYIYVYQFTSGKCNNGESFFKPLWNNQLLNEYLDRNSVASLDQLCDKDNNGGYYTEQAIEQYSSTSLLISKLIVYINYILIFVFLTLAFGFLWARYEKLE